MAHKRLYVRIPITGEAILSNKDGVLIKTPARDINKGGLGVTTPATPLEQTDYQITITTEEDEKIQLTASLVHKNTLHAGFQTSDIDKNNLQIIADIVAKFQTTEAFIEQIDKQDLLEQSFIDEEGNGISVTFDIDSSK
jgi:hypothetical protein